ncbi:MAG: 50S ribosomal protein L17 [Candidatus Curtissbacteria bacterium GW2011_GWA1_40_9]|uniref:50S ribosomal protein L17 n=1 Tax=Candidatus Curtissbacteria bacterium GW2011_GWA1_40_9 TaxID=1618408 RepID=A0A0G0TLY3_9BACT|nr:MAG: 50S ribosomal protein L17 [Candidatus Curtissbacteria bacterium GW2011_GWA1_40_9]
MKHRVFGKKLSRDINSRKALLKNLTNDLILHGQVKTTLAKAKFVKSYIEKAVTKAKKTKLGSKRVLASTLTNKAFLKLVDEIAPGFKIRQGGYTRIIRLHPRVGDNASMARIELLKWDKSKSVARPKEKKVKKAKATSSQKNKKSVVVKKKIKTVSKKNKK